jgi:hypothetical protein
MGTNHNAEVGIIKNSATLRGVCYAFSTFEVQSAKSAEVWAVIVDCSGPDCRQSPKLKYENWVNYVNFYYPQWDMVF